MQSGPGEITTDSFTHPKSYVSTFKVRVAVVLVKDGCLLLMRQNGRPFWVLPGGTLEPGEGLAECAARELAEEAGLTVSIGRLLYVSDFIHPTRQTVDVFFAARWVAGDIPNAPPYPENIDEIHWLPLAELSEWPLAPTLIKEKLLELNWEADLHDASTFPNSYLGKYAPASTQELA